MMDSVGVNVIETAALGRPFQLGMLYDCRKDALIPGITLWDQENLQQSIRARPQINTDFKVTASDSIEDKSNLLNIDGGLKLSLLGGLVSVTGSAKYLNDTKKSFNQQRLTLHYHSTSKYEELTMSHLAPENIVHHQVFDNDTATHVVTAVLYGADACFVFDREVSSDEDKTIVEGDVKAAFEKLKFISVDVNINLEMNDTQKTAVQKFSCTFYGDFQLASNPTTFEDAVKVFADLPKLLGENKELAVPVRVWLYPLDKLLSKTVKLQKDISIDLITDMESVIESLRTTEMKCSDLLKDTSAQAFTAFHDKILNMRQNCYKHKLRLMKKLGSLLPNIRGDMIPDTALTDLLKDHEESPFSGSDLEQWLEERQKESDIIQTLLRLLNESGAKVEDNLDNILMDLDVENVVSYTFTSLDWSDVLLSKQKVYLSPSTLENKLESKQKSWLTDGIKRTMRNNLKIFKNLIDSKDCKAAKFIVSSKEMENNPGSCILLYEDESNEAVCFSPPSKPARPIAEEIKDDRVVVKVSSSCPATVELRLLFKMKEESDWTSQPVLKNTNTVTVTDLRAVTEYQMKCAAVGKLNYTVDSDVITVTTERRTRNRAVSMFSRSEKHKLNLVLCGSDTDLKTSVSKLIRGIKTSTSGQRSSSECVKKEGEVCGRLITLVELPALSQLSEEEVMRQSLHCVSLCHPGVHVFLLIIPVGPITDEDKAETEKIQKIFYSRDHFMVLFTSRMTVNEPLTDFAKSIIKSQSLCGGRHKVMGLKEHDNTTQISELLDYIENMKTEPYSPQMCVRAQEKRGIDETEEKYKEELKRMENTIKELQEKLQRYGAEDEPEDLKCLRFVLIGRTGSGKSATGNTILGRKPFQSQSRSVSVMSVCQKAVGEVDGKSVAVVDTPGLFDTSLSNEQVLDELVKCVSLSAPGPHVFIIVLSLGRFTKEEVDTLHLIKKIFGPQAAQFSIVLFTRGDDLEDDESIEDYVKRSSSGELKKLIRDCGNRYLVFNNRERQDRTQVTKLLNMIEEVKNSNQGRYFTNCMFEEAEMSIKKRMKEILEEKEREIQAQKEELKVKYEMEMKDMMKRLEEEKQKKEEERLQMENKFREKEETVRKQFEEKEKSEQKKREMEDQKRSEEEKQQKDEYNKTIEDMKREIENVCDVIS